ncbi:dynein regulatory complex subunit 7 [Leuresthes tenuis]|uniref:dynein regulatory complex subunit 7 n=1 Tax=Leuresthes tenuis TaxID=355514 RepID=UPI003B50875C
METKLVSATEKQIREEEDSTKLEETVVDGHDSEPQELQTVERETGNRAERRGDMQSGRPVRDSVRGRLQRGLKPLLSQQSSSCIRGCLKATDPDTPQLCSLAPEGDDCNTSGSSLLSLRSPESYRTNSADEIRLLAIADNFQRQYLLLYPDRKPLLLCPANECGVKKFVSTTIRPTTTSHCDLLTWQDCASFVADFLLPEPLEPPVDLPKHLFSSTSVLRSQRATCFESATLLCSLLLGVNYDAYCVSGYAVKEMCLLDKTLQQCPLLDTVAKDVQREITEQERQENKYAVKPPRELDSRFLSQQEKKKQQEAEAALLLGQTLEPESEQRPADFLRGLRVHCWVLVLSGSHSVQENFFIDPLTGNSYATDSDNFLGIESVWNNLNYYVNMQDCKNGCAGVVFDLEDLRIWEPVLYGATSKKQLILDVLKRKESKMMSIISSEEEGEQPRVFQMPRSWVSYITISKEDLEIRWPGGKKVTHYRKAKLERFAPCLNPDGLVTSLTTYKDLDCTEVTAVRQWYKYRSDNLEETQINKADNFTSERFRRGRAFHLLFHRWRSLTAGTERQMEFSSAHGDNLVRRVLSPSEMEEYFEGRSDFLCYRHVFFNQHVQPPEPSHPQTDLENLHVQKVVEHFNRNASKPANEDVAERVFLVAQRRIELAYHLMDHRFIPSKRSFLRPRPGQKFTPDMVSTFQVDLSERPLKTLTLHRMLNVLIKEEDKVALQIQKSLKEVKDIVTCREQEEKEVELWTTSIAAAQARRERKEKEIMAAEEERWLQEQEKDVMAPLLIRLGNPEVLSPEEAEQLYESCLSEFRDRLEEQTNLLQQRYETETMELQSQQKWYQQYQHILTQKHMEDYQENCSYKTLQIAAIQKRLHRHSETVQDKYYALDEKLRQDPRLAPHLNS